MSDGVVSSEPVIAPLPTPISVEPRTVAPAEAAEVSRQAEEAKVAAGRSKDEPKAAAKDDPKEKGKPVSTRDAIRAAAAKVHAEPTAEKASPLKAAEPAPAAKEPVAAKVDAKAAEPAAKEPVKAAPARAEDGKYVSTKAAEPVNDSAAVKDAAAPVKAPESAPAAPKLPSHTAEAPPARFSAAAKEKWAETSEEVRAETTRAVTELTKGFEKHRAAAERDAELGEFHEMATKGGTTVKQALSAYVNMENVLRADPLKGFELICQNAGLSLRELAAKVLNQTPEESATKTDATIAELRNEIAELKKGYGTISAEREQARTKSTTDIVTQFAADPAHSRFDELADDIKLFLETGRTKDLAEAYALAERLNPAPAAAAPAPAASTAPVVEVPKPKPTLVVPAASTAADDRGEKSIAGAPSAGSDPVRKQPTSVSVKEAIRRAAAAAR